MQRIIAHAPCSYPGMLAGWLRLKFPHLLSAAVASSAPVRIVVEMRE
jgi:serine protease 16